MYSKKRDGTYEVVDILTAKNNEATVPSTFNGKDITSINISIFTNDKLKEITITDGNVPMTLSNFEIDYKGSRDFNKDIKVNLSGKNKDSLVESINQLHSNSDISGEDSILLKNLLTLSKEQGSHIVNVQIKPEDANKINGFSIGQISIENGEVFDRSSVGNVRFSYEEARDCFDNNDKYYLDIVDSDNNSIFGKAVEEDKNVTILFVSVYRIILITDTSTITKYIKESDIETYYNDFKTTYDGVDIETKEGTIIKTLSSFIESLHSASNNTLNIAPANED